MASRIVLGRSISGAINRFAFKKQSLCLYSSSSLPPQSDPNTPADLLMQKYEVSTSNYLLRWSAVRTKQKRESILFPQRSSDLGQYFLRKNTLTNSKLCLTLVLFFRMSMRMLTTNYTLGRLLLARLKIRK